MNKVENRKKPSKIKEFFNVVILPKSSKVIISPKMGFFDYVFKFARSKQIPHSQITVYIKEIRSYPNDFVPYKEIV